MGSIFMSRSYRHGRHRKWDKWIWAEPKLHRRLNKHKKRRAEVRGLVTKTMRGKEELIWPLDKKPWIYYH